MRILLTFAGHRDPFNPDEVLAGQVTDGPVLTALAEESFDRAYVFADKRVLGNAGDLVSEIARRFRSLTTDIIELSLSDPTDYEVVFSALLRETRPLLDRHKADSPQYFIATASGTPQMQTVWFLLARSRLLPATLLKITPKRYLRPGARAVSEIRLSLETFPTIEPAEIDSIELASLRIQNEKLEAERETLFGQVEVEGIVGRSPALQRALRTLVKAAQTDDPILILGETGTGKELFARLAHKRSRRATAGPLISVDCPALAPTILEAELFGIERRVATDVDPRKGKFELADAGTIFFDEIGDLPLEAQAKLLRVLQTGEVPKLGARDAVRVNVHVIAATNMDLKARISERLFREDLYYRLSAISLTLPPLRERREDIPLLVARFLRAIPGPRKRFSKKALRLVTHFCWPGNVRELENFVKRSVALSEGTVITDADLPEEMRVASLLPSTPDLEPTIPPGGLDLDKHLASLRKAYYDKALKIKAGNHAAAARLLSTEPHTFRKRARRLRT